MLNISKQHLSGPQRSIVTEVYNAAVGSYPVSDQTWYNFNLFSAWRNTYYLVYRDYSSYTLPSLLTDLLVSYSFEGNSNDPVSGNNGTDHNISYNLLYGKVLQGASFNGLSSYISITPIATGLNFSISFWMNPSAIGPTTRRFLTDVAIGYGFQWYVPDGKVYWACPGGFSNTAAIPSGSWSHIGLVCTAGHVVLFLNGVPSGTTVTQIATIDIARIGDYDASDWYEGYLDILSMWSRPLSNAEMLALYNGGAGIQYPF